MVGLVSLREGVCSLVWLTTDLFWVCNFQCFTLFVSGIDYSIGVCVCVHVIYLFIGGECSLIVCGSDCGRYF